MRHLLPVVLVVASGARLGGAEESFEVYPRQPYSQTDKKLLADVYVPSGDGPYPGVLLVHGGAWRFGHRGQMRWVAELLARNGFTAVSITYRLAPHHRFPAQLQDCRQALNWMHARAERFKIDAARIAGYGYSAGGHLVALLATTQGDNHAAERSSGNGTKVAAAKPASSVSAVERAKDSAAASSNPAAARLRAVVAGGMPCDFRLLPRKSRLLAYWLGGTRAEKPDVYRLASPAAFVTADDPPMFFFHGERDVLVPVLSPVGMQVLLNLAGVEATVHVVEGAGHFKTFFDRPAADLALKFLTEKLKPAPASE